MIYSPILLPSVNRRPAICPVPNRVRHRLGEMHGTGTLEMPSGDLYHGGFSHNMFGGKREGLTSHPQAPKVVLATCSTKKPNSGTAAGVSMVNGSISWDKTLQYPHTRPRFCNRAWPHGVHKHMASAQTMQVLLLL